MTIRQIAKSQQLDPIDNSPSAIMAAMNAYAREPIIKLKHPYGRQQMWGVCVSPNDQQVIAGGFCSLAS